MIRTRFNSKNNLFTIIVEKRDQSTQTDECVALNIGDKILSAQLSHPPSGCKGSATSHAWWQALFKWN
jgi:hypothetical protein